MILLLAWLFSGSALAVSPESPHPTVDETEDSVSTDRPPLGLGVRVGAWQAESAAPLIGGHLAVRLHRRLRIQAFADHALKGLDGVLQTDHVIGFHLIVPVLETERTAFGPTLGSCVDFRIWRDRSDLGVIRSDVLFGPRAGLHLEHDLDEVWSVQASTTAVLYVGNTADTYGWGSGTSDLDVNGIVQAQLGLTRWW